MRRRLLLIRHGTHDEVGRVLSGRSEIALNTEGVRQAKRLARSLEHAAVGAIHTSPRRRTRETAAAIAAHCGSAPVDAPALDEIDFGAFTGRSFADLDRSADWRHWNAARDTARCPQGETMAEAVDRSARFLAALPADPRPAICVTHCDIIRGIVAWSIGVPYGAMFSLPCDPGSVTTVDVDDGTFRLVTLNALPD